MDLHDFMNLHDFVKNNYEKGNYDFAKKYYENNKYNFTKQDYRYIKDKSNDFQLGYSQALNDYKFHKKFKHYPMKLISLINLLSNNKAIEISSFIRGYLCAKKRIKKQKESCIDE